MATIPLAKLSPSRDFNLFEVDARRIGKRQPHRHDFYEVIWFHVGGGHNVIDFVEHAVVRDRLFFMAPGQVHELRSQRSRSTFITFDRSFVKPIEAASGADLDTVLFNNFDRPPFLDLRTEDAAPLVQLLNLMRDEHQREAASWAILQALLSAFLLNALRLVSQRSATHDDRPLADERVTRVRRLVDASYLEERDTAFYAKAVGLTSKRINELTRATLGKTVAQLITDRIILQAKRDLYFTSRSVKEVAHDLSFEDPAYFSRFFKRHTGATPGAFRATRST